MRTRNGTARLDGKEIPSAWSRVSWRSPPARTTGRPATTGLSRNRCVPASPSGYVMFHSRSFTITEENFALLDRDLLWNVAPYPGDTSAADFAASPVLQNLAVVREGRYRSLSADRSQAILFWTPLGVPFLVDALNELVASYGGTA